MENNGPKVLSLYLNYLVDQIEFVSNLDISRLDSIAWVGCATT